MSARFVTEQEKRDQAKAAADAKRAEEQEAADKRRKDYTRRMRGVTSKVTRLWKEFVKAREMSEAKVTQTDYSLHLTLQARYKNRGGTYLDLCMFRIEPWNDTVLHLRQPDNWRSVYQGNADDLAQAIADATKREVRLTIWVPEHRPIGSDDYYMEAHHSVVYSATPTQT